MKVGTIVSTGDLMRDRWYGVVVQVVGDGSTVGVELHGYGLGHDCVRHCKPKQGMYLTTANLKIIEEPE